MRERGGQRVDVLAAPDILIVGAGAAGLAAAIFAKRLAASREVVLLDGATRPGAKILVSGGSRCNVTNTCVGEHDFWGGRSTIVRRVLRSFSAADAIAFFRELGVALREEPGGKLFPTSNRSRDVLDALLRECTALGARLLTGHRVLEVSPDGDRFHVRTNHSDFDAGAVIIATGGLSLPKTGSDGAGLAIAARLGHSIVPTTPALAPFILDASQSFHAQVSGVTQDVELTVWIDEAVSIRLNGALLWTHFGVSGPVALNASRHWLRAVQEHRDVTVTVNFCPGASFDTIDATLVRSVTEAPRATVQTMLAGLVPAAVAGAIVTQLGIAATLTRAHLPRDDRRRLARALGAWRLPIVDSRGYAVAEATAGGVRLDEVDPSRMESRRHRHLFFAGEILDVDGRLGGFNFQWAWSTGFLAGRAAAASVLTRTLR